MGLADLDLSSVATALLKRDKTPDYIQLKRQSVTIEQPSGKKVLGEVEYINLESGVVNDIPAGLIDGTLIKKGDVMITADNSVEPVDNDVLIIGGVEYSIVNITPKNHAGVVQVYKIQGRR